MEIRKKQLLEIKNQKSPTKQEEKNQKSPTKQEEKKQVKKSSKEDEDDWKNKIEKDHNENQIFYDARKKITSLIAKTSFNHPKRYYTDSNYIILIGRYFTNKFWYNLMYEPSIEKIISEYIDDNETLKNFFLPEKKKIKEKEKIPEEEENSEYYIYDEGKIPYVVELYPDPDTLFIYKNKTVDPEDINYGVTKAPKPTITKYYIKFEYDKIFLGDNCSNSAKYKSIGEFEGNSILAKKDDEFLFIGSKIFKFKLDEKIIKFCSPIKTKYDYDYTSYPYLITDKSVIFFGKDKSYIVEISNFNVSKDDIPSKFKIQNMMDFEGTKILFLL